MARGEIKKSQLTTFNGLVVALMQFDCEVTLAKASGVQIVLSRPSLEITEIEVSANNGQDSVVFYQHYGQNVKVQGLRQPGEIQKNGIKLVLEQDGTVTIETVPFKLVADRYSIEVEATPASYNKVQGLMGTHDSERSTDMLMNSEVFYKPSLYAGIHHLSQESSRKLLEWNRVNTYCQIPSQ